jgi:membrane fusion protein, multidrug efflux system
MLKSIKLLLAIVILLVICISGYKYWSHQQLFPSTDDAYLQSNVINVSPNISGQVIKVYVKENQKITKGEDLFAIDPKPYQVLLNKAKANMLNLKQEIDAKKQAIISAQSAMQAQQMQLKIQQRETNRTLSLVKQNLVAAQEGDQALDQLNVSKAQVSTAKSNLANAMAQAGDAEAQIKAANADINSAKINLNNTKIIAPAEGTVNNLSLRPGSAVNAYQTVFAIVEDKPQWISANFKETQLTRIHPGQKARVQIDMYPGRIFSGIVESISSGSGTSFSLIPTEQATGNWVKVTQRYPVRILLKTNPKQQHLRLGASANVTIDTTKNTMAARNLKH